MKYPYVKVIQMFLSYEMSQIYVGWAVGLPERSFT